jgi:hypothetical protein
MTGRWIVATCLLLVVSACGMTGGLRPLPSEVVESAALAGPVPSTPPLTVATEVATVTLTTLARTTTIATTATTPSSLAGTTTTKPNDTTTSPADETNTTIAEPVETTATSVPAETTTTEDAPPTSSVSIPDFPDIGEVFSDDGAFLAHDCAGGDVTITGDSGTYTLEGGCLGLLVKGSFNTIFIDSVNAIDLTGTLNVVIHGTGNPVVNDWDGENIVTGG